jgi:hypothetical protein
MRDGMTRPATCADEIEAELAATPPGSARTCDACWKCGRPRA